MKVIVYKIVQLFISPYKVKENAQQQIYSKIKIPFKHQVFQEKNVWYLWDMKYAQQATKKITNFDMGTLITVALPTKNIKEDKTILVEIKKLSACSYLVNLNGGWNNEVKLC